MHVRLAGREESIYGYMYAVGFCCHLDTILLQTGVGPYMCDDIDRKDS
jgi:hypothetical protein